MSLNLHQFWDTVVGSIGLRCLAGVYPGPVVPSPPVDRRPVEDVEQEEEHLDYYRYYTVDVVGQCGYYSTAGALVVYPIHSVTHPLHFLLSQ